MAGINSGRRPVIASRVRSNKSPKRLTGDARKLKALKELDKTNKELKKRSKVSGALFEKRDKLMNQLGMEL